MARPHPRRTDAREQPPLPASSTPEGARRCRHVRARHRAGPRDRRGRGADQDRVRLDRPDQPDLAQRHADLPASGRDRRGRPRRRNRPRGRLQPSRVRGGQARPGVRRLAGVARRFRRGADAARCRGPRRRDERLPRRARDDRPDRVGGDLAGSQSPQRARPSSSPPPPARSDRSPGSSRRRTAPGSSASPGAPRSARCSPTGSASTPPSTTRPTAGSGSSPRRRPTGSTSTSRTSAARSWKRSSRGSTCAPGSPSAG